MKRITALLAIAAALVCAAWTTFNTVGSFTFSWDYTGQVQNFVVYYGTNSFYDGGGNAVNTLPAGSQSTQFGYTARSATINNLPVGVKYYFVVTAKDVNGFESLPSNQLTNTVPLTAVPAPTNARTP